MAFGAAQGIQAVPDVPWGAIKVPLRNPESSEDWGERTHSGAWSWSVVWLYGGVRV